MGNAPSRVSSVAAFNWWPRKTLIRRECKRTPYWHQPTHVGPLDLPVATQTLFGLTWLRIDDKTRYVYQCLTAIAVLFGVVLDSSTVCDVLYAER